MVCICLVLNNIDDFLKKVGKRETKEEYLSGKKKNEKKERRIKIKS